MKEKIERLIEDYSLYQKSCKEILDNGEYNDDPTLATMYRTKLTEYQFFIENLEHIING
jgi:hypothetical protein